jgi:hypothetical protein
MGRPSFKRGPYLRALLFRIQEFCDIFGAAVRVSRAVEARVEPAKADLLTLGIKGELPTLW